MKPIRRGNALYAPPGCCSLRGTTESIPPEVFVSGVIGLGVVLVLAGFAIAGRKR